MSEVAVMGAGAYGTALSIALAADHDVSLWARNAEHADEMASCRENRRYLAGLAIPKGVRIFSDISKLDEKTVLLAVPAQKLAGFLEDHAPDLIGKNVVLCCKGVDRTTGMRPSELATRALPDTPVAILTGPSFAKDIAAGLPTALCLASQGPADLLQQTLSCSTLRLYATNDVVGAELGGAIKNVIALAAGMTIGSGLGDSARAAVITRGFAELSRFAVTQGAQLETLSGLSGLGDLLLTCTSEKSRNFSAGVAIAKGEALPEGQTIEGLETAKSVASMAREAGINMPLTQTVSDVTQGALAINDAITLLMTRPLKRE